MTPEPNMVPKVETAMGPGVVSSGWLAANSVFERRDEKFLSRISGASAISLGLHAVLAAIILFILAVRPITEAFQDPTPDPKMVYLQQAGPGGGGGGSPAPAPAKPLEIARHKAPDPIPIVPPEPVKPVVEPPKPTLNAPVETSVSSLMQATGASAVSLANYAGGGSGGGIGQGRGNGVGQGEGGGFGGGAYRPGAGINNPSIIRQPEPKYTSEAMRAKIQGVVELEAVVMPNGLIGDVRVTKSLDKQFGLDQEAIKAAKLWLFRPGTDRDGKPVPVLVTLILEFRLH